VTHQLGALTPRQLDVLALMAAGYTNGAIARRLSISEKAVVQHVSHIYDLLVLPRNAEEHRRVLAVVRYLAGDAQPRPHEST
jgi:DNA-binding NarL/FixJ family response regulator